MTTVYQINLQQGWGGGEVYTVFMTHALAALGVRTVLLCHPAATARWRAALATETGVTPVEKTESIGACLPSTRQWLLFHTPVIPALTESLCAAGHLVTAMAHMPLYGRDPARLAACDWIFAVSRHVIDSLAAAGVPQVYGEPLYGIADLAGRDAGFATAIHAGQVYDWDRRKGRDRLLGMLSPLLRFRRPAEFVKRPGITLGIVSRLTPIKQLPLLFQHLAPVLARHPRFNLEIFGSGGYASVRDLRRALAPLGQRVRFWGQQQNVGAVYRQLDYLMTGLPEKEALGLNVLEAQTCGTPVLAVLAPPFTETVDAGITGLFYADPRHDKGQDFDRLLSRLEKAPFRCDPAQAAPSLARFSAPAFEARVARLLDWLRQRKLVE